MSRHAAGWTGVRLIADRFVGRTTPGKHHPIWDVEVELPQPPGLQPTPCGGMEDRAGFAAMARELAAA